MDRMWKNNLYVVRDGSVFNLRYIKGHLTLATFCTLEELVPRVQYIVDTYVDTVTLDKYIQDGYNRNPYNTKEVRRRENQYLQMAVGEYLDIIEEAIFLAEMFPSSRQLAFICT